MRSYEWIAGLGDARTLSDLDGSKHRRRWWAFVGISVLVIVGFISGVASAAQAAGPPPPDSPKWLDVQASAGGGGGGGSWDRTTFKMSPYTDDTLAAQTTCDQRSVTAATYTAVGHWLATRFQLTGRWCGNGTDVTTQEWFKENKPPVVSPWTLQSWEDPRTGGGLNQHYVYRRQRAIYGVCIVIRTGPTCGSSSIWASMTLRGDGSWAKDWGGVGTAGGTTCPCTKEDRT